MVACRTHVKSSHGGGVGSARRTGGTTVEAGAQAAAGQRVRAHTTTRTTTPSPHHHAHVAGSVGNREREREGGVRTCDQSAAGLSCAELEEDRWKTLLAAARLCSKARRVPSDIVLVRTDMCATRSIISTRSCSYLRAAGEQFVWSTEGGGRCRW